MRRVCFVIFLLLTATTGVVFGDDPKCHRSTEGKEFWFGFMEGRNNNGNVHYIEITVTAREKTKFSIFTGKSVVPYLTDSVNTNSSRQIKIPLGLAEAKGSESIQEKAIYLLAENPVNVYALNWDRNSADVAVIYPVQSLGREYFTMCYTPNVHNDTEHGRNSEFLVVASEDNTTVEITPSVVTDMGRPAKVAFTVTLNKGEVYQVQSLNRQNLPGQGDLTGSFIKSDKPVAVYSGNFSTTVPSESGMSGYDHLFEQIPPLETWGREYYAVPLLTRRADRYRVMASEDDTQIQIGTQSPITLNRGQFREFLLESNQPSRIFADKPILVAQFSQSNRTDEYYTGGNGDPFMIVLSSVSQSKNEVTFVAYQSSQIREYYINIVVLTTEKDNIQLDGNNIGYFFKPFTGSNYSYAQIKTFAGNHTLKNNNPNRGFLAYIYGYGGYESYGYGVGFNLDLELDLRQTINFEGDTLPVCKGDIVVLDAGPYFDDYLWNTGETTQKIYVMKDGKYWAQGTTRDGCVRSDSIYILVSEILKPDLGPDKQGCAPYSVTLNAGTGYAGYHWNTGVLSQVIEANQSGNYAVTVYDKYGCHASDTVKLTVFPVPVIRFSGNKLVCGSKSNKIKLSFEGYNESSGKMEWSSDKPGKLTFGDVTNTSCEITVSEWGAYKVTGKFTTPDGCVNLWTEEFQFWDIPSSTIEYVDDPNDKCKGYSREIKYTGNATSNARYFWNYGGCQADSLNWNLRRVSLGVFNSNPVISLFVDANGCRSDTSFLTMGANPDFKMNTAKSRGCDSATIQFSGELKTPDDLKFDWNFGDNSPGSNLQNPNHFYSSTGNYDVSLVITNRLNGCKAGYTVGKMVSIYPVPKAEIAIDPDICHNKIIEVVYAGNIDSSFCTWNFEGAVQIGAGNDSITVSIENQVAKIKLRVEEFGCKSHWAEISVKRKPEFKIITDVTEGCPPLTVITEGFSNDAGLEYKWVTDSAMFLGDKQSFILRDAGKYGFVLSAKSSVTGCSATLSSPGMVEVHPKPEAGFDVDYPSAILEHATLTFTNYSKLAESFKWDFDDGSFSVVENPKHTFTALGKFQVKLLVESAFGCTDTSSMRIDILPFDVYFPNAFRPGSDIAENRGFMPVYIGVDPNRFLLQVFNRWGEVVFESNSPDYKWDGTSKNNRPAPMGNYIWIAEFSDIQGFRHTLKGQVLLIR